MSRVAPIPKPGKRIAHENMRPISVTNIIARLFERLVYSKYVKASYNTWLPRNQFGFRARGSPEGALISLQNTCRSFYSQGFDYVRIVSIDLSKAFDTVQHRSAIQQLANVRPHINPYVINWVADFLCARCLFVSYKTARSSLYYTNQGVPQGTVGGPFLFNVATADLNLDNIPDSAMVKFADDGTGAFGGRNSTDWAHVGLDVLLSWCAENNFKVCPEKSQEIVLSFKPTMTVLPLAGIPRVTEMKSWDCNLMSA